MNKIKEDENIFITNDNDTNEVIEISDLMGKEVYYYNMIDKFFNKCDDVIIQKMVNIINGNNFVSLRFLDWFVTRYCYLYKLSINVNNDFVKENNLNINISYKAQLKSFKKKHFDPFRRKKKFIYIINKVTKYEILTTVGQLNFFRWAFSNNIISYAEEHYKDIVAKFNHVNSYFIKNKDSTTSDNSSLNSNDKSLSVLRNINLEL
jgi:hypothetical protein